MEIIPAIDIINGKCVRLSQGDFARMKTYNDDPLEVAKQFEGVGLRRLHMVDLDGAKRGKVANLAVLENVAKNTSMTIDFGGGIKSEEDLSAVFSAGSQIANIGSIAVKNEEQVLAWLNEYGSDKFLLGADVRNGKLAIHGWQTATEIELLPFLEKYFRQGVSQAFVTDIASDGLLQGPSIELYSAIRARLPELHFIASGGVSSMSDIYALEKIGCAGVIIGKAIYEGRISLSELARYRENVSKENNSLS